MTMMMRLRHPLLLCLVLLCTHVTRVQCFNNFRGDQDELVSPRRQKQQQAGVRGTNSRQSKLQQQEPSSSRQQEKRRLMMDGKKKSKGGDDDNDGGGFGFSGGIDREFEFDDEEDEENANGLVEPPPRRCAQFTNPDIQTRARNSLTDEECVSNTCGGGCCRVFHWLICDESNSFDHLQCVCNQNTSPPPPTPFPTMPPTNAPTPSPTPSPTSVPPTSAPPTTARPVATAPPTAIAPIAPAFPDIVNITVDREDSFPLNPQTITVYTPPPVTPVPSASPTAAPSAVPTESPPTTSSGANDQTPAPGPVQPWAECAAGSIYHGNSDANICNYAEDCVQKDECCIKNFCLCGDPGALTSECVPSRFV